MANFPVYNKNNIKIIAKRISNSKKEIEIALAIAKGRPQRHL